MAETIQEFEAIRVRSESEALEAVSSKLSSVRKLVQFQVLRDELYPPLFECLYKCVQRKQHNLEMYKFALQFAPDIIVVYLHAVYESQPLVKANAEALLLSFLLEYESDKTASVQVPTLSKPSIYHQFSVQTSQLSLTESALLRHNQTEAVPAAPYFSGSEVSVNNRLEFLSSVIDVVTSHMTAFSHDSKQAFCQVCIRLSLQGMAPVFDNISTLADFAEEPLGGMRRYSVNDQLMMRLLHGVRVCLFQSCNGLAVKALEALKLRAEYELLTSSIQLSRSLTRLVSGVFPEPLQFSVPDYASYRSEGHSPFEQDPFGIHSTLHKNILQCNVDEQHRRQYTDDTIDTVV